MEIYLINCILTYILAKIHDNYKDKAIKNVCFILILFCLCIVSGLRYGVGTDFFTYYNFYNSFPDESINIFFSSNYEEITSFEKGFSLLVWGIGQVINNPQFITFIISLITILPILITIRKYSPSLPLGVFLYISTMSYYSSFNGVRQWVACSILFFSIKYIFEKSFLKYFIITIIATFIHNSAFIFIFIYFIVNYKAWSKQVILLMILSIVVLYNFSSVLQLLSNFVSGEEAKYFLVLNNDRGINYIRILVAAVPPAISFFFYKKIKIINNKENIDVLINFSLLNFIFRLLATKKNIISRFSLYFGIYNALLIPFFVMLFIKKDRHIITTIIIVLYLIHMILLLPVESNLLPYKFFFE